MKFMSPEWMSAVARQWNAHEEMQSMLKNFSATIEYGIEDRPDIHPVMMFVKSGKAIYAGPSDGRGRDFIISAKLENWQKLISGAMSGKAGLMTKRINFKGSMMTAMKYMTPFNIHMSIMGEIPADFDV